MAMAPRSFATAVAICRAGVVILSVAALACTFRAPGVNFRPFIFLQATLILQLFWNLPRLLYDAAQVVAHVPLPPQRLVFSALVVTEWVATLVMFAAGSSAMAVMVFFQIDTGACGGSAAASPVPAACSHWHAAGAALTLSAWLFSLVVAVLMFWLRASTNHQD